MINGACVVVARSKTTAQGERKRLNGESKAKDPENRLGTIACSSTVELIVLWSINKHLFFDSDKKY